MDFYGYDVEKNKLPGEIQLHNATVKAVDNYEVSSRRKMLQAEERKLVNLFEREQLRKKNENG